MKNTKKILLRSLVAATVTFSTASYADGLLSGMLGKKDSGFTSLISHVPVDTSYIFANKKPIPSDVMQFHINRGKQAIDMFSKMDKAEKSPEKPKGSSAFIDALLKDLGDKINDKKFEDSGLSLTASSMIYGLDMMPVLRLGFSDKEKIMATIKRAEEASDFKVELTKCGDFDCFVDSSNSKTTVIVILKDHIAASVFPADQKEKMVNHLIGKTKIENPYDVKTWDTFLESNKYTGYGDGYVNLQKIYKKSSPLIAMGLMGKIDEKELEGCMSVIEAHVNNMPELLLGTKRLETKNMDYEFLFKTSSDVSSVLQGIANKKNISKRSDKAIIELGLNINFPQLREAITQYSNFLIKSGKTNKCSAIDAAKIRKSMGGMAMVMNMGLSQFKSIYASVSDVKIGKDMNAESVTAFISIGTDDPGGLIAMAGMANPALMGFKVPDDGSTVKLPEGVIPSKGVAIPPIFLNRTDKSLNVMVGNDKPALSNYDNKTPQIMIMGVDGKRYYEIISDVLNNLPKSANGGKTDKELTGMIDSMGGMMGVMTEEIFADDRGLVVDYHIVFE